MSKSSVIKRRKKPTILVPLMVAVLTMILIYFGVTKKTQETIRPIMVPFAAVELSEHTRIDKDLIKFKEIPASSIPPNVIIDPNELIDKYVATKHTIPVNGLFYKEHVVDFEQIPSRIGMMLDEDNVGLTMRVNLEKSVANSLRDDMEVQVRFYTDKTPSGHPFEGVLEERIRIIAVRDARGTDVSPTVEKTVETDEKNKQKQTNKVPTVIVFEATEEQASYLLRAQKLGELNILALSEDPEYKPEEEEKKEERDMKLLSAQVEQQEEDEESQLVKEKVEKLKQLLDVLSSNVDDDKVLKEQKAFIEELIQEIEREEEERLKEKIAHGDLFGGNEVKLFIDSLTHTIEDHFKDGYFITPKGEVVVYDEETDTLRYFETKERFMGSKYVLQEMTQQELEEYFDSISKSKSKATYRGQGSDTTPKILLSEGLNSFDFKYEGAGSFKVTLLDSSGRRTEVIDHRGGKLEITKAVSVKKTGFHVFEIETEPEGAWEIKQK